MPVHYAGVGCEMDAIMAIAERHGLLVIEDAAQALPATLPRPPARHASAQLGALSFHETKNVICGEGGALLVNDPALVERAEIMHEKGTNRSAFFRGQVDKYTWVDVGSSFLLSEHHGRLPLGPARAGGRDHASAACESGTRYHEAFAELEARASLRRPVVPERLRAQRAHVLPAAPETDASATS